jgi:predicted RNA binding protein YcfA (HicA-like mRNA interferase family)
MPRLSPINNKSLIKRLRQFGFEGPFSGGKHLFMIKNDIRLTLPNPHRKEIGIDLLRRILKQANISVDEWIDIK